MEIFGIAILAAGLMGAWHVTKFAIPRTMRAIGRKRSTSVATWNAENPAAPTLARWGASAAKTFATLRWGPKFLVKETRQAWLDGIEKGRQKYGVQPSGTTVADPTDPNDTKNCPECAGDVVVDGEICPRCLARQRERNREWDQQKPDPFPPGPGPRKPSPRPRLVSVPSIEEPKENTMIETATGGEIVNAEQFHAEAQAIVKEAAADMEDAAADNSRAQEDLARVERMVASLSRQKAVSSDIAAVTALRDPASARAAAAKDRQAAAEQRLAGAKAVVEIAARHVQLIGQATGPFYNAA